MHEMESANSQTNVSSSIDANLEIRIKDFQTASKSSTKGEYVEHSHSDFNVWFSVSASPNGFDEDTEGWLVVRPYVTVLRGKYRPQNSAVSWTVSVIDIEGNNRLPRSFSQELSKDISDAKYLERSFILSRADDFLPEGVLTVRCDICLQWYNTAPALAPENHRQIEERATIEYVPRCDRELDKNDPETEDPIDDYADFVKKNKILTEVLYLAHTGKVSAMYDPPSSEGRHPKAWKFDTRDESFNVVLDDRRNNIGTRLLKASPVIRRCVDAPMKERREKRIELPNVASRTFKNVVYFVMSGNLPKFEFGELFEIYKFSHMYEMEVLQRNCAEDMMNSLEHDESDFIEMQKIADFYSDGYFSELLHIRRHGDENLERDLPPLRMDDKPYSDCYV